MVKFNKIRIQNYKSVDDTTLEYKEGIWLVLGVNNDATFKSNGAGKSTILEAIQQCLFNKTIKNVNIDDTYNRKTQKAYTLTVSFNVDTNKYVVTNNRELGYISILENDTNISRKGIPENLKLIQDIIGFDFSSFCAMTYVSQTNIVSLLDTFSSSSLMKVLLDFDTISLFENRIKDKLAVTKQSIQFYQQELIQLEESKKLLSQFEYTNLTPLYKLKQKLQDDLLHAKIQYDTQDLFLTLNSANNEYNDLSLKLNELVKVLSGDICPTCNQPTIKNGSITRKLQEIEKQEIELKLQDLEKLISITKREIDINADRMVLFMAKYNVESEKIDTNIAITEYKNKLYLTNKEDKDNIDKRIFENKRITEEEYFNQELYEITLKTIKSGKLHKELLDNFTKVLNTFIDDYTKYMSINYLNIKAKASKTSIEFLVYDDRSKQFIELNTLSGGELTRVRIIILMSMLKTVGVLTNLNTNILILDEALDTLDDSAAKDLSLFFRHLIATENKFIALVSHGNQLNSIEFNGSIIAEKTNGTTIIKD